MVVHCRILSAIFWTIIVIQGKITRKKFFMLIKVLVENSKKLILKFFSLKETINSLLSHLFCSLPVWIRSEVTFVRFPELQILLFILQQTVFVNLSGLLLSNRHKSTLLNNVLKIIIQNGFVNDMVIRWVHQLFDKSRRWERHGCVGELQLLYRTDPDNFDSTKMHEHDVANYQTGIRFLHHT